MFVPFSALWFLVFALQNFTTYSTFPSHPFGVHPNMKCSINPKVVFRGLSLKNVYGTVISCRKSSNDNFVTLIKGSTFSIVKPTDSNPHLQGRQQRVAKPG